MIIGEGYLLELGVAGIWILTLLYDKYAFYKIMTNLIKKIEKHMAQNEKLRE